jgi:hypothetical protein
MTPARHRNGSRHITEPTGAQSALRHSWLALLAGVTVVLLMSAIYVVAPAKSGGRLPVKCGTVDPSRSSPLTDIKAYGVTCRTARGVAGQWAINARANKKCLTSSCRVRSFRCRAERAPNSSRLQVFCNGQGQSEGFSFRKRVGR